MMDHITCAPSSFLTKGKSNKEIGLCWKWNMIVMDF